MIDLYKYPLSKQIISANLCAYLLNNHLISVEKITKYRKASYSLPADIFSNFMKSLQERVPRATFEQSKMLLNSFLGGWGEKYNKSSQSFITNSFDMMCGMFWADIERNLENGFCVNEIDDGIFLCKRSFEDRKEQDHGGIHRAILSAGIINLFELLDHVYEPNVSKLIGVKTDCVFVHKPKSIKYDTEKYMQ